MSTATPRDVEAVSTTTGEMPSAPATESSPVRGREALASRVAVLVGWGVLALVVVALPFAIRSMATTLFGDQETILYNLNTGEEVPPVVAAPPDPNQTYINIAVVDLDVATGEMKLAVSGNRACGQECFAVVMTLYSLDDNPALRRGVPPLATITLSPEDRVFSQSVTLPVRGHPNRYPFDTYDLWLGIDFDLKHANGKPVELDELMEATAPLITLQSQDNELLMMPPHVLDLSNVVAPSDPYELEIADALLFQRPDYLKILTVLLVALITVSGGLALWRRDVDDLLLGFGGLILGVWGIRAVLTSQPVPGVTAIDLALSFVILFLLVGLTVKTLRHLHVRTRQ
jgi:hypothetical protein